MNITKVEVQHICKLAKIKLGEEGLCKTTAEFEEILQHMKCIEKFDFEEEAMKSDKEGMQANENIKQTHEENQTLRKDEVVAFRNHEKLFKNTKDMKDGYIRIPKIIE
ncbi:MAG: Asp-tRNA(Asn)/Glu-tRNA(Gln) amidotransferase subunit GatC [Clostridiales bacterium]|nr:Asp-tRNA(Asn)/Glu-tRNA(Gln) amidotransferase subunit GatC [Clostridiales bacterium]